MSAIFFNLPLQFLRLMAICPWSTHHFHLFLSQLAPSQNQYQPDANAYILGRQNTRVYPVAVAPEKKKNQSDCLQCRQGHRPQLEEGTQDNWPEPMHEFVLQSSCCQRGLQQQWCLKSVPRKWDLIFWSIIEHEKIRHMGLVFFLEQKYGIS